MFRHRELQHDTWVAWLFILVLWCYNWSCLVSSYTDLFRMLLTQMQFSVASNQICQSNTAKAIETKGRSCAISSTNDQFLSFWQQWMEKSKYFEAEIAQRPWAPNPFAIFLCDLEPSVMYKWGTAYLVHALEMWELTGFSNTVADVQSLSCVPLFVTPCIIGI